ncbi:MAG: hypothetical protein N4A47_05655 [Clostridia bacterium]|nr:hypothetical protein [Clostridia bacterium]
MKIRGLAKMLKEANINEGFIFIGVGIFMILKPFLEKNKKEEGQYIPKNAQILFGIVLLLIGVMTFINSN